ncbi:probable low-specificity L-threonine aldolase 2 [Drosophila hydei]|uniref:Probable low-specificity L-threonine aldolase 2 n=1 Tax=Drosophila hydei TaxID=7224 RepID=A0A6J1MGE6_DROHY|nr:probable low-specificity L-threonine aldolase 2 [Drosophila hydei]XP_023179841.2 probable low-specificity L-threonine aldolase 2 [Drosophila hydei]XP_023179842.2 probable low-specificity L-threonine aldolase 2 [Drosophila hydei]
MASHNNNNVVDLRSDTVSQPTPEMRARMASAVVGDDVYGEDPTLAELEAKTAAIFGKEAGLFVPSGTMGNLLAVMVHCQRRGSEAIVGDLSHIFLYEQGGSAHLAGVQLATLRNQPDGTFSLEELRHKIRQYEDCHEPVTALVVVENTHNICGGKVLPLAYLDEVVSLVRDSGLGVVRIGLHMDGARVFNAAAALGVSVERIARGFDSVSVCLSKSLSAPVGSVLVGSKKFIAEAHRLRKALGGGMRQAGILAAAGLVALEEVVPLLPADHDRTKRIAKSIDQLRSPNIVVDLATVQSNILLIQIKQPKLTASQFAERLAVIEPEELLAGVTGHNGAGIVLKASARNWEFMRLVLYHQVDDEQVDLAIKKLSYVIKQYDARWP